MPTPTEFAVMLVKDDTRTKALALIDKVLDSAFEAVKADIVFVERIIDLETPELGPFEIEVLLAVPSAEEMEGFNRFHQHGGIVFDEVHCIFAGREYDALPAGLSQANLHMLTSIVLFGRRGRQPFVKLSVNNTDEPPLIDFRRLDGFSDI